MIERASHGPGPLHGLGQGTGCIGLAWPLFPADNQAHVCQYGAD
jgi:hypothetical protein